MNQKQDLIQAIIFNTIARGKITFTSPMLLLVTNKKMKNNKNVKQLLNKITQLPSPD